MRFGHSRPRVYDTDLGGNRHAHLSTLSYSCRSGIHRFIGGVIFLWVPPCCGFKGKPKEAHTIWGPLKKTHRILGLRCQIPIMSEWYGQVHELMLKESVTKDNIAGAVSGCKTIRLRDGMLDLLQACQTHDPVIPVIIMSAGLGDVIEEFLRQVPFELGASTHIVSNRMAFDAAGRLVEFSEPLLHMFNKTAAFFPEATKELVKGRRFCMLFGDGVGDSTMADGLEVETLKVGFLNEKVEERLLEFQQKFDVVVTGDGPVPELAFAAIGAKSAALA
ncbi:unnamed protein product [Effrenium voratum]|nr:unnamed protein product [Effrenium voratum]